MIRFFYLMWFAVLCTASSWLGGGMLQAQTLTATIGTGSDVPANTLYSPVYRFSSTSSTRYNRSNIVFTATELAAVGIFPGAVISELGFDKAGSGGTIAGNDLRLDIYMANSSTQPPLANTTTWADIQASHTQVYGNTNQVIPTVPGWVTFTLSTPFTYLGGSLEIATEAEISGSSPYATDKFDWVYTDGFEDYIIAGTSTNSSFLATLSSSVSSYKERPNTRFTFSTPTGMDAGLLDFPSLSGALCPGSTPVSVTLTSLAADPVTGATIEWTLNGLSQGTTTFSGSLGAGDDTVLTLGSFMAMAGTAYDIEAYITSSSPGPDIDLVNDTLRVLGLNTGLEGAYTIDAGTPTGGTNYASFNELFADAMSLGMCGPVVATVAANSGPYSEQVLVGEIPGADATNTFTLNGSGETLTFLSTANDERATLKLDRTDYLTVNNLRIVAEGSASGEYGFAVQLMNGADFNAFNGCEFIANESSTSTSFAGFVTSNSATSATTSGLAASNLTVTNCLASGGYYGIVVNGPTSAPFATGNVVTDNEIVDFRLYGLYLRGQDNGVFAGNRLYREDRAEISTTYMIYFNSDMSGSIIANNEIFDFAGVATSTSTAYGIYGTSSTSPVPVLINNNLVYGYEGMNGTTYGAYFSTVDGIQVYHNTVSLDNVGHTGSSLARAFFHSGSSATDVDVRNNIFSVTTGSSGTKYCMYFSSSAAVINSNYNVLHMGATSGTNHTGFASSTSYTTLADWQGAGYDANSLDSDPVFTVLPGGGIAPANPAIEDFCPLIPAAPLDFAGVSRGALADPGALEFTGVNCLPPSGLTGLSSTQTSITADWTDNSVAAEWQIEYGPVGFTLGSGDQVVSAVKPATFSGLMPATSYDFYVRAICAPGDTSDWSQAPGNFFTACGVFAYPFSESFNGPGWVPGTGFSNTGDATAPCWSRDPENGSDYFWGVRTSTTGSGSTGPNGAFAGDNYVFTEGSNGSTGDSAWIASPEIDLSTAVSPVLMFYYHLYGADMGNLYTQVNNGSGWTSLDSLIGQQQTGGSDPWERRVVDLASFTGDTVQLRWLSTKGPDFTSDMALDSVTVAEIPPCGLVLSELPLSVAGVNDATCHGASDGSIEVTPSGGTGPYTYDWSTGSTDSVLTGVGAGTYDVTVTDATGCPGTVSVAVGEPLDLALSVLATDVSDCAGDSTGTLTPVQGLSPTSTTAMYSGGLIDSDSEFTTFGDSSDCPAILTVNLPQGAVVTGVDVSYSMTAQANAFQSEQRSWLTCPTTGLSEASVTSGPSVFSEGTATYTRTGLTLANGVVSSGVLEFALHLGRTWPTTSDFGCNALYNFGEDFQVTVYYETTGGIGQLNYLWSTGDTTAALTGVPAGTYTLVLSDAAGCADTATATVAEPAALTLTTEVEATTCEGEADASISATIGGGTGPLTFLWSNGVTDTLLLEDLAAGTYALTVTDSLGCTTTDSVLVEALPLPMVTLPDSSAICEGDSLVLDAGTGFAAYAWSDSSTAQTLAVALAGSYAVTVTDSNGCVSDTATAMVTVNPLPVVTLDEEIAFCEGDSAILDAGAGFASYTWTDGSMTQTLDVFEAGTYDVVVTSDEGCASDTASTMVTVDPLPMVDLGPADTTIQAGQTLVLDAGTDGTAYDWSTGATTQTIDVTEDGVYTVVVLNDAGCVASDSIEVTVITSLLDAFVHHLKLYPNPSAETSYLDFSLKQGGTLTLQVYDARGRVVGQEAHRLGAGPQLLPLDLQGQAEGVYFLRLTLDGQLLTTLRLIRKP